MQMSVPVERKHGSPGKHDIFSSEKKTKIKTIKTLSGLCITEVILEAGLLPWWYNFTNDTFVAQRWPKISPMKNTVITLHLPFPDIRPSYRQSCVFTLDHSQHVSHTLVYNCASSFKCAAENVSLCAPSSVPWHTARAVHLRKGHSSRLTNWGWWLQRRQWPF